MDREPVGGFVIRISSDAKGATLLPGLPSVASAGIGATTVMFGVVYSVLINPYPHKDAERIMHIHILDNGAFLTDLLLSPQL